MDAFRVLLTVTSAEQAPLRDNVAVWVCKDFAWSLLAPERFASRFVTEPSTLIDDAPLDSSFRSLLERLLAVKLTAPFTSTSVREALETIIVMPLVGLRFSLESICRILPVTLVVMSGRRF